MKAKLELADAAIAGDGALIIGLKAELAEAKKDVARYHWLRDNCVEITNTDGKFQLPDLQNVVYEWRRREWVNGKPVIVLDGLDAAIDAAMKGK